jgi:glycogen phosphorylase
MVDRKIVEAVKEEFADALFVTLGRIPQAATRNDHYLALAIAVRRRVLRRAVATYETYYRKASRTVCYLSAEFLLGPHLANNLLNLGIQEETRQAMAELGFDLDGILAQEEEPGLGNGGLGRLAACFMDSLASLQVPAIGYGIRYEFGIFDQLIRDGWQVEKTDKWLALGNPWEIPRPEVMFDVGFGGRSAVEYDDEGRYRVRWLPERLVRGVAYDTPIPGYRNDTANLLRLFKAEATESFDFDSFNQGDYWGAVDQKVDSENITKVLYPNDERVRGKQLRLEQQHFFVSCALQDMIRIFLQREADLTRFNEKFAVQLNDTHPAVAVTELMRLLVDVHGLGWDEAWETTRRTFAYTNHTLLPEALEKWPVAMFGAVLPRHLEIVYEINRRFLDEVRGRYPGDDGRVARLSLIDEAGVRSVRMANLASVGSYRINGVAALHTDLLKAEVLRDVHELWPEKILNVTNGVTPRRFLALANPRLAELVNGAIGEGWARDLERLRALEPLAEDAGFREEWRRVKRANKADLAAVVRARAGVECDPDSLFDVQVKRIHEYKRQHLNLLHVIALWQRLRGNPGAAVPPRTVLFGGKAAPSYWMAKLIIKLIHSVAEVVNADPLTRQRLRVAFLPDYNVQNCMPIFPAAELSEQISTAGKEASGTGNMKFAMNGALTIGTLDGANVEIREAVGPENFFLFGLSVDEIPRLRSGGYRPRDLYHGDPVLRAVVDAIADGTFSRGDGSLFLPILDSLLSEDPWLALADFRSYTSCQAEVERAYQDPEGWTRKSILNTARMGRFSSDRSIADYCRKIWRVAPVPIHMEHDPAD